MQEENGNRSVLAFSIYPLPKGTEYKESDLRSISKVEKLFECCQMWEGGIRKAGWDFLISFYGYERLFEIDKRSGWFGAETLDEFISCVETYIKELPPEEFSIS